MGEREAEVGGREEEVGGGTKEVGGRSGMSSKSSSLGSILIFDFPFTMWDMYSKRATRLRTSVIASTGRFFAT